MFSIPPPQNEHSSKFLLESVHTPEIEIAGDVDVDRSALVFPQSRRDIGRELEHVAHDRLRALDRVREGKDGVVARTTSLGLTCGECRTNVIDQAEHDCTTESLPKMRVDLAANPRSAQLVSSRRCQVDDDTVWRLGAGPQQERTALAVHQSTLHFTCVHRTFFQ